MRDTIIKLLEQVKRPGMTDLIEHITERGFFDAPCSTDKHLSCEGGLARHSFNVFDVMLHLNNTFTAELPYESLVLCGLLHDLGKMGDHAKPYYAPNVLKSGTVSAAKPYITNKDLIYLPHEVRSVMIIERFIELTEDEEAAILWHNGLYGAFKYDIPGKETQLYMVLHFADMWASRVVEERNALISEALKEKEAE